MSAIYFHHIYRLFKIRNSKKIKCTVSKILDDHHFLTSRIDIIFCNDHYLLNINKRFLRHDDYTDIITFLLSDKGTPIISEIYISLDAIKDNAKKFAIPIKEEILRVIFHGILHLAGFKDKTNNQKKIMRQKEEYYIRMYQNS